MERYPENTQEAYEQQYQELADVMARVFNKIITRRASASEKTWADVGSLEHITKLMQELDEFLGPEPYTRRASRE